MDFELMIENDESKQAEVLAKFAGTANWAYGIVELEATFVTDGSYGADADGNRGVSRTELDDWWVTSIKLYNELDTEVASIKVAELSDDEYCVLTDDAVDAAWDARERIN